MIARDNIPGNEFKSLLIRIAFFFLILVLIYNLRNSPQLVERYYSQGFYLIVRGSFQFLFNYIPFSIGDILYCALIVLFMVGSYKTVRLLIHRKIQTAGLVFLRFVLQLEVFIAVFYILWAINYLREPANKRLDLANYEYDTKQLIALTSMLIDSANSSRSALHPQDLLVSNREIILPAIQAVENLRSFDPPVRSIKPMAKISLLSPILNYIGTAGYYNPLTGEAHFNSMMPVFTRPFVACHEMAHQMGFGAEDEANFAGFIAGKSSNNRLLKYSAYYLATQEFMTEVWRADSTAFKQMKQRISAQVLQDMKTERAYWTKYQGGAATLSSIFYDNYLKANKQPGGLTTYNKMIKLSMAYYRKNELTK